MGYARAETTCNGSIQMSGFIIEQNMWSSSIFNVSLKRVKVRVMGGIESSIVFGEMSNQPAEGTRAAGPELYYYA